MSSSSNKITYTKALLKNDKLFETGTKTLPSPEKKPTSFSTSLTFQICGKKVVNEYETSMCSKCEIEYDNEVLCVICGKNIDIDKLIYASDTADLKKKVLVCISCYNCEACTGCGYLGGASPCRWCRGFHV